MSSASLAVMVSGPRGQQATDAEFQRVKDAVDAAISRGNRCLILRSSNGLYTSFVAGVEHEFNTRSEIDDIQFHSFTPDNPQSSVQRASGDVTFKFKYPAKRRR